VSISQTRDDVGRLVAHSSVNRFPLRESTLSLLSVPITDGIVSNKFSLRNNMSNDDDNTLISFGSSGRCDVRVYDGKERRMKLLLVHGVAKAIK